MKGTLRWSAVGLLVLSATGAMAVPDATVTVVRTAGYYDTSYQGGEFTLKGSPWANPNHYSPATLVANGLQTFCLELNEFLSGQPFHAYLNTVAINGGVGGGSPDPLSIGTAWLYKRFAEGTLPGYNYTPGPGRAASARELQEAIWYLEDELGSIGPNPYIAMVIAQFGSLSAAKTNYNPSLANFQVRVVNLYGIKPNGDTDWQARKQDMIVYLPDGGMTLILMGGGLLGLALVRRKA
ncbi:MAG: hypothetical protein RMN51_01655 [Verrucomicrobiota bacterium]|nr:hypothetical protein [Limisphaera sp.]MDW8380804.1 hypothetical protein [Verrucomicrobiota bacterium]